MSIDSCYLQFKQMMLVLAVLRHFSHHKNDQVLWLPRPTDEANYDNVVAGKFI